MIELSDNKQSRKWHIVLHNPTLRGWDYDVLTKTLLLFKPIYFCFCTEISAEGVEHYHIYILANSPIRFSTLKRRFEGGHFEVAKGTAEDNKNYCLKEGAYADTKKAATRVDGSFFEWGEMPTPEQEARLLPSLTELVEDIEGGLSTAEIIHKSPKHALRIRHIEELRQTLLDERFSTENRNLTVTYLYGKTGVGKTRSIFERHDPRTIYRVTHYRPGQGVSFDGYTGAHRVLVFEEFHGQVPIGQMLNFLDIYPLRLPARYADKTAVFDTVYLTSNLPPSELYPEVQREKPEVYRAFLRRIHFIREITSSGLMVDRTNDFKKGRNHK